MKRRKKKFFRRFIFAKRRSPKFFRRFIFLQHRFHVIKLRPVLCNLILCPEKMPIPIKKSKIRWDVLQFGCFAFLLCIRVMETRICNPVGLMMQIGFKSGNSNTKCLLIGKSMRRRSFVLRYGVVTAAAPRMTTNYTFYGKQASFECSVFFYRFQGVLRTGGCKSASGRSMWWDGCLIETYQGRENVLRNFFQQGFHSIFLPKRREFLSFYVPSGCMWAVVWTQGWRI